MLKEQTKQDTVRHNRWLAWTAYAALALIAGAVAVLLYWLNASDEVLRFNEKITVVPDKAQTESVVYVNLDYCKTQGAVGTYSRRLVSERQEVLNQTGVPETSNAGCVKAQQQIFLPKQLEAGTYRVKFVIVYQINPLKETTVTLLSEPFTVL